MDNNSRQVMDKPTKIFMYIVIFIGVIFLLVQCASADSTNDRSGMCKYSKQCNNQIYSYKNNLNGYCEKHRKIQDNSRRANDIKNYLDSNK